MKYPLILLSIASLGLSGHAAAEMSSMSGMAMAREKPAKLMPMKSERMSSIKTMAADKSMAAEDKASGLLDNIEDLIRHQGLSADDAFILALQNPQRPMVERLKDLDRKPFQVLEFAGIKPGMRVLNLLSYYGYYAEVLAYRVGKSGQVIAQNTPTYASTGKKYPAAAANAPPG